MTANGMGICAVRPSETEIKVRHSLVYSIYTLLCPVNLKKMKTIINNENALPEIIDFLKKYFENVREITNSNSHLANRSQNFWATIVFESRNSTYSI